MYVCIHKYMYLSCELCKESTMAKDRVFNSTVTFHFILAGKPGSGWTKSIVSSENLSKLRRVLGLHRLVSRRAGLPNSSYTESITRHGLQ